MNETYNKWMKKFIHSTKHVYSSKIRDIIPNFGKNSAISSTASIARKNPGLYFWTVLRVGTRVDVRVEGAHVLGGWRGKGRGQEMECPLTYGPSNQGLS